MANLAGGAGPHERLAAGGGIGRGGTTGAPYSKRVSEPRRDRARRGRRDGAVLPAARGGIFPRPAGCAARGRQRRGVPARERAAQRADRHLDRSRDRARADGPRDVSHRSDLVRQREPVLVRRPAPFRAARARVRGAAADRLRPDLAQPLRSPGPADVAAARGRRHALLRAAAGRRRCLRNAGIAAVDELDWWESRRIRGRRRPLRAEPALERARPHRPERDAVERAGSSSGRRAASTSRATPGTSRASARSGASRTVRARGAADRRLRAVGDDAPGAPESRGGAAGGPRRAAPRACSACTTARSI